MIFIREEDVYMTAKKRKNKAPESLRIHDALDMPKILKPSVPHIETEGNREVMIDGCRGISEYDDGKISLNAGNLTITFKGTDLTLCSYSESQSMITGNIVSIEFTT